MICLAALAMRRRSRSVPRDAPEREQIVGLLSCAQDPQGIRPLQVALVTSGRERAEMLLGQTTLRMETAPKCEASKHS